MKRLGDLLTEAGLLSEPDLQRALEYQQETGKRLGEAIIHLGLVHPEDLLKTLSQQLGFDIVDLRETPVDQALISQSLITPDLILRHQVFPVRVEDGSLVLAMVDPLNLLALDDVRHATGMEIRPVITTGDALKHAYDQYFGVKHAAQKAIKQFVQERQKRGVDVEELRSITKEFEVEDAPIVKLVDTLISGAVNARASDIHMEPKRESLRVRYRVDGILMPQMEIPRQAMSATLARVKVLAGMDTAERRKPQDGRIFFKMPDREIDLRVVSLPTVHGEKIVMRVLDRAVGLIPLTDLGFSQDALKIWDSLITRPYGIILLTGPTGSGKTTTLYASLRNIASDQINILTIEEPVEYEIQEINQIQVNPKVGVTFSTALRSFLRADPDVMLIGEIRDYETAEMAIQSSLTGHLVFSTLHTNDAPGAIIRLTNIGVEPYLVNTTLLAAAGQRLIRVLCPYCKQGVHPDPNDLEKILPVLPRLHRPPAEDFHIYRAVGCKFCNGIGYKGRIAIFEIMVMTPTLREMAARGASHMELKSQAMREGMVTLYEDGIRKILDGVTTIDDVLRVVPPEERLLEIAAPPEVVMAGRGRLLEEAPRKLAPLIS
jgi:type IV pilus assembly protein PilB